METETKPGKQPTHHHFLPARHLRRFSTNEKVFCLRGEEGAIFQSSPQRIAKQRHLYCTEGELEVIANGDSPRPIFEHTLEKIEDSAGRAIDKILDGNPIEDNERVAVAAFVATLLHRTPAASDFTSELANRFTRGMLLSLAGDQNRSSTSWDKGVANEAISQMEAGHISIRIPKDFTLQHMIDISRQHALQLLETRWSLLFAPPGTSFVTGDMPVVYHNRPSNSNVDASRTYTPITKGVCLQTGSDHGMEVPRVTSRDFVRSLNESISLGSTAIVVASSERLLRSLHRFRKRTRLAGSGRMSSMPDESYFKTLFDERASRPAGPGFDGGSGTPDAQDRCLP